MTDWPGTLIEQPPAQQPAQDPQWPGQVVGMHGIDFNAPDEQVRSAISALPEAKRQGALDTWADAYVTRERAGQTGLGTAVRDVVRGVARGTPIGSFLDEANAATSAMLGGNYDEAVAYQRAQDRAADRQAPGAMLAANLVGGYATVRMLPGPSAIVGNAASLPAKMGAGAVAGAGYGALYGLGEGETTDQRIADAAKGAVLGGVVGTAAPAVGQGLGTAFEFAKDRAAQLPNSLRPFDRGAVDRVAGAAAADRGTGQLVDVYGFGPQAMLLDQGPNLLGHAEALASRPGSPASMLIGAVAERGRGAPERIISDVNAALGPQRDTPALLAALEKSRATDASSLYGALRENADNAAIWSSELQDLTSRPSVRKAINEVSNTASERGYKVQNPFVTAEDGTLSLPEGTSPNFMFWDNVKRGIDKQIAADPTNGDIIGTKKRLTSLLDESVPGYKEARSRFADQSSVLDAIDNGRTAFKKGVEPNQMRADLSDMSIPERAGYVVGGRQQVADIMGEAVRPDTAARTAFASPYARQRLEIVAGPGGAERLTNRLDAETAFKNSENTLRGGSPTARRQAYQELYPAPGAEAGLDRGTDNATLTGLLLRGGRSVLNAATSGAIDQRNAAIATDAARLLSTGGPTRQQVLADLLSRSDVLDRQRIASAGIDRRTQVLLNALRAPAIGYAASDR